MLASAVLIVAGCASTQKALDDVTVAEVPEITQIEASIPLTVGVAGRSNEPVVQFVAPPPVPKLTEHEKAVLDVREEKNDLLEFYRPKSLRRDIGGYDTELRVGTGIFSRTHGVFETRTDVSAYGPAYLGVTQVGGFSTNVGKATNLAKSVTRVGNFSGEVGIGYIGPKYISAAEQRRHYRR